MACPEVGPSVCPWRGSKYGRCRVDHGPRRNQPEVCEASSTKLSRSYPNRPVFVGVVGFDWKRVEKLIQHLNGIKLPAIENLSWPNPTIAHEFVEFRWRDSEVHRGLNAREATTGNWPEGGESFFTNLHR